MRVMFCYISVVICMLILYESQDLLHICCDLYVDISESQVLLHICCDLYVDK